MENVLEKALAMELTQMRALDDENVLKLMHNIAILANEKQREVFELSKQLDKRKEDIILLVDRHRHSEEEIERLTADNVALMEKILTERKGE